MIGRLDKFGRILIPKKIRENGGYHPGTQFEIVWDEEDRMLMLKPVLSRPEPILIIDDLGIPTFDFGTDEVFEYDFTAAIKEDRETRGNKNLGLD